MSEGSGSLSEMLKLFKKTRRSPSIGAADPINVYNQKRNSIIQPPVKIIPFHYKSTSINDKKVSSNQINNCSSSKSLKLNKRIKEENTNNSYKTAQKIVFHKKTESNFSKLLETYNGESIIFSQIKHLNAVKIEKKGLVISLQPELQKIKHQRINKLKKIGTMKQNNNSCSSISVLSSPKRPQELEEFTKETKQNAKKVWNWKGSRGKIIH